MIPPLPWSALPLAAKNRTEAGWWEADTVRGKLGSGGLVTLVDRSLREPLTRRLENITKTTVADAIIEMLRPLPPELRRGLIPDQGKEFYDYAWISAAFDELPIYFAPPHSPWLRGTNENTNGLIREYFPKGTNTRLISDAYVQDFTAKLQNRPRKCLGYRTPAEALQECCT